MALVLEAQQSRTLIAQRPGHDLAGGGRTFVHQHHQRDGFESGRQAFERIRAVAPLVKFGRSFVGCFALSQLSVG